MPLTSVFGMNRWTLDCEIWPQTLEASAYHVVTTYFNMLNRLDVDNQYDSITDSSSMRLMVHAKNKMKMRLVVILLFSLKLFYISGWNCVRSVVSLLRMLCDGWSAFCCRQEILHVQTERRQRRQEMTKRRTHASQNRMKILTELAQSNMMLLNTVCLKKTPPTFLAVTWTYIFRFQ